MVLLRKINASVFGNAGGASGTTHHLLKKLACSNAPLGLAAGSLRRAGSRLLRSGVPTEEYPGQEGKRHCCGGHDCERAS